MTHHRESVPLPVRLSAEQIEAVASLIGKSSELVNLVTDGINDVLTGDPIGTIRRSPSGQIIAVRVESLYHPYETFCPHGSASWMSDSVYTWPIVYQPDTEK
jgi:hypothetical protein